MEMTSDRSDVVKCFRLELEASRFHLGQLSDPELESWLFQPGPDRLNLLQWCVGQLDPALRGRFQDCDEKLAEKRTVEYVKSFGLSHNTDVILGTASLKDQDALWKTMLLLLKLAREPLQSPIKGRDPRIADMNQTLTSIIHSKDIMTLLHSKVKLMSSELCLTATALPLRNAEAEFKAAVTRLEELQEAANDVTLEDDEKSTINHSVQPCEDYKEAFLVNFKKMQECYDHLAVTVFPAVKTQPESLIANSLGNWIENLADAVTAFVQMLKSTQDIHRMAESLKTSSFQDLKSSKPSDLQHYISRSHSLITETLSLCRLHNMMKQ